MSLLGQRTVTVTIEASASLSTSFATSGQRIVLVLADGWNTAAITYLASWDNVNFTSYYNEPSEFNLRSASMAGSRLIELGSGIVYPMGTPPYMKLRSGTTASPVNQTSKRTLTLVLQQASLY